MDIEQPTPFRAFHDYRWDDVACLPYKDDGTAPFKAISRQVLFAEAQLGCELRYFEMATGGYSTLEPLGFLCMVNTLRDRPQLPTEQELATLKAHPAVAAFLTNEA